MKTFTPDLDPAVLERLRASHLSFLSNAETASGAHLYELDTEFHEIMASFTCNVFFVQAIQQQNRLRRLMEYRGYENRRRVRVWVREHLAIIDALEAADRERAARLMDEHLDKACRHAAVIPEKAAGRRPRLAAGGAPRRRD
jgi:DNA-binding GntR family transcriptional regulator